jgi:hypothetical protein
MVAGRAAAQAGRADRQPAALRRAFRQACELVRNGRLGKIDRRVGLPKVNFERPAGPGRPPPPELDYDFWLGPAPQRPYNEKRVHYLFRFFWDYSGGQLTNFGAHHLDIVQWALGMDESGPSPSRARRRFHPASGTRCRWFEHLPTRMTTGDIRSSASRARIARGGLLFHGSKRHALRHPRQDRGGPGGHPQGAADRGQRLPQRQPPRELARLHPEPRGCRSATPRSATARRRSATSGTSPSASAAGRMTIRRLADAW